VLAQRDFLWRGTSYDFAELLLSAPPFLRAQREHIKVTFTDAAFLYSSHTI
jgi:hypothetical protein